MKKRNLLCILVIVLCVGAFIGYRMLDAMRTDTRPPEIQVSEGVLEASVQEPKSALTRGMTATDREDGDVTDSLVVESIGILGSNGTISVTYAAFDAAGNVAKALEGLLVNTELRRSYSSRQRALVDGNGAHRLALKLVEMIKQG